MAGSSGGGSMADSFINLGDKLHKNFNQTMQIAGQNKRAVEQNQILLAQLEQQKKEFGLKYALERLMAMSQIKAAEKEALILELTGRASAQSTFLDNQAKEMAMRDNIDSKDLRARVGKGFAVGFANAIKNNGKLAPQQASQGPQAPLLPSQQQQRDSLPQPAQNAPQQQGLLNSIPA